VREPLLHTLHQAAGARLSAATPPEVLTFGDVPGEYRAGLEQAMLLDETALGRLAITGPDALAFLHRMLANDVRGLAVGAAQSNLLLSSKGKVLCDFELLRLEEGARLVLAAASVPLLATALDRYLFTEKVVLADESERTAPLALCGPRAAELLRAVTGTEPPPAGRWVEVERDGAALVVWSSIVAGSAGWRVDAGPAGAPKLWQALVAAGARPGGVVARDCLRVEAGAALSGVDIDEHVYPQEARLERAFSLSKGCYVGQEVVAKIDTYGGINKRLTALRVSHDDPVARGTRLHRVEDGERRDLGLVTSWAYSFVLDSGLVLAYVKRRHQAPGTEFELGDTGARAVVVPLPVRTGAVAPTGDWET